MAAAIVDEEERVEQNEEDEQEKEEDELGALLARPLAACADEVSKTNSRDSTKSNETNLTTDGADTSNATSSVIVNEPVAASEDKTPCGILAKSSSAATNPSTTCSEHHSMLEFAMMNFKQSIDK
jgi:hypothetical protein